MTPTEVLQKIQRLPLPDQRQILVELAEHLRQIGQSDLDPKEEEFLSKLRQSGIITEMPARLPDDDFRKRFRRIEVQGEPISETIIKERG